MVALLTALGLFLTHGVANASGYMTINGSGSSWAYIALSPVDQRRGQPQGLTVNYNPDGSAQGRQRLHAGRTGRLRRSDPPFRNGHDKLGGEAGAEHPQWGYSYVPDTAGGTAFMYHITVDGHLIRNLRLTPKC